MTQMNEIELRVFPLIARDIEELTRKLMSLSNSSEKVEETTREKILEIVDLVGNISYTTLEAGYKEGLYAGRNL
jgi:hypothetical protein